MSLSSPSPSSASPVLVFAIASAFYVCLAGVVQAQIPPTDPSEAKALNSIFNKWNISPVETVWNISGEICSGQAVNNATSIDDFFSPFIKCDCSSGTTCHIYALSLYQQDVVGQIPPELWTFTHLTYLNLSRNYLTGSVAPAIGNLSRLQSLGLGDNALSGKLPKELGSLTELVSLSLGTNNFSGPIPSKLGNLVKLKELLLDSTGFSGPIPSTLANLKNLEMLWVTDLEHAGSIPDFIGSLSNLTDLRLQCNSFQGSIPSSLGNLTSLRKLYLKNNNISDSLPSNMDELFPMLTHLDWRFNNIMGQIPNSLFRMPQLEILCLGNNALSGTIPTHIILPTLKNIGLPFGHECLQKNFPCYRGPGRYSNFAIKCGGPSITLSDGTKYQGEDEELDLTTSVVTDSTWAVSNVGFPRTLSASNSLPSQFTATIDPDLFHTARGSTDSLRYYGLGLQNGDYQVTLDFVETSFPNDKTWKSLGRRVFDIYLQGSHVLKDFDIRREAGGASFRPVRKEFQVQVTENYIEVHLNWAAKGTRNIPEVDTCGPLISAIKATKDFRPPNRTHLTVGIIVATVAAVSFLSILVVLYIRRRKNHGDGDDDLLGIDTKLYTFNYSELKNATNDFNPSKKLGEGGFGPVYKGTLNDGRVIAVKRLSVKSHQGNNQFKAEIATISAVQHRNLVTLYGCCIEGNKRLLVYQYLENGSLDNALFRNNFTLNWPTRYDICIGVARGLAYLHEESRLRIVHRDIKASNVLLDHGLLPKISDFGLAKLYDDKMTHISTGVAGTIGYLAPEYALRGHLTEKADVFSFGVLALEIVSGRRNSEPSLEEDKVYLLEWVWQLHEENRTVEVVDLRLLSDFNEEEVKRMVGISLLCTQASPSLRPAMSRVVAMLSGDIEVSTVTSKPGYLTDWKFDDVSSFMTSRVAKQSEATQYDLATSASSVSRHPNQSPVDASKPILQ
ncbi:probable LRR receptor-like serine/threonine-protein kinase At1g56130 [Neltuma alba]|uniref:probable LRR receptor-like serine/threonine-protein kinase At1g56130 n=1 Tax=Neltuma alba TaxID=207710 RepID=UPI0010A3C34C|nr:probable LRR receptor-like serine/threonine-protein kinase At1g56130 [Prosopis alba]